MKPAIIARLLWCLVGAAAAILLALWMVAPASHPALPLAMPFLLASLGGSAVFLFGLTRAPAAQPRALFGGHLGGAFIGIACFQWLGDALWVYALAQSLALAYMLLTQTVHPPAGANPLIMIYGHAGFAALWNPVLLGVLCLLLVVVCWSRVFPGQVRYPAEFRAKSTLSYARVRLT